MQLWILIDKNQIVCYQGVGGMGSFSDFDPNSPSVPRNCTITRPPPITKPCR